MVEIPLILKLKRESHKKIAEAQDLVIRELYSIFNDAVLHGGTSIWRCYNGNRFSEDIDIYIPRDVNKINLLFSNLEKRGFIVEKKKIGENSLYSNLKMDGVFVRLEALFKKARGSLKEYETVESNFITIYTLTPEELIIEKVDTYLKRLKIRDLYDIFFLLRFVKNKSEIKSKLEHLIKNFKKPADEKELKVILLEGIVPNTEKMLEYIGRYI
jgi:predicted nucleotidyltransferase component of viral defense system